jgi:hypothetical protein
MKFLLLALLLPLAACGTLPEPFYGNPGPNGARLAIPPAPVLMVPTPGGAMLDDSSAQTYAQDLATQLANFDVPSIAGPAQKTDWRVVITAKLAAGSVVPAYDIIGPDKKNYGAENGAPVPAAAWANGDTTALQTAAATDAKTLSALLVGINARVQGSNPNSLENRPSRVFMGAVTGAPGDGNSSLKLGMTRDLPDSHSKLVSNPANADFLITGNIRTQPDGKGNLLVELDWSVADSNHRKIGQVTQLHDLAAADIEPYWGDVAAAAAAEAAKGVQEVMTNATLKKGS